MSTSPGKPKSNGRVAIVPGSSNNANVWSIWYAAKFGKVERVRFILDHKKAGTAIDDQEPISRWSALHFACRHGHFQVIQLLISRGANPDLADENGNTPLHLAAGWGNLRCCVLTLEAGANVSVENHFQQTPLDIAKALARTDQIQLLERWQPAGHSAEGSDKLFHYSNSPRHVCLTPFFFASTELKEQRAQWLSSDPESAFLAALTNAASEEYDASIRSELHALYSKLHSFGEDHPGLLITLAKLGSLYRERNRLGKALEMTDRGLSLCEAIRGEHHPETATWLNNTGELLLLQKRCHESCHFFSKAHNILAELKGDTDHEALVALENTAIAHHSAGDSVATILHVQQLLVLLHKRYQGGYNEKVLELSLVLAFALLAQKRTIEAKAIYEDCLAHVESLAISTPPDEHLDHLVRCIEGVGKCWFLLGDFQKAEELFRRSLRMVTAQQQQMHQALDSARLAEERQRVHRNVAMVAIAKKSAPAVQRRLQLWQKSSGFAS